MVIRGNNDFRQSIDGLGLLRAEVLQDVRDLGRSLRVVVCGLISTYNRTGPMPGPTDFGRVLMRRLTIRGFIVIDYLSRAREALF